MCFNYRTRFRSASHARLQTFHAVKLFSRNQSVSHHGALLFLNTVYITHYNMSATLVPPRTHYTYIHRIIIDIRCFGTRAILFLKRQVNDSLGLKITNRMSICIDGKPQDYEALRDFVARMYQIYFPPAQMGDAKLREPAV